MRIGRRLRELPATADAFSTGALPYSKVRTLTRIATPDNETELLAIAVDTAAGDLGRALAAWLTRTGSGEDLDRHHRRQRSVRWRTEPDGMVTFTLRLPPLVAAMLIAWLTKWVMTSRRPIAGPTVGHEHDASADASTQPATVAQQHADAIAVLLTTATATGRSAATAPVTGQPSPTGGITTAPACDPESNGDVHQVDTELVIHIRGDGCSFDDGTPITDSIVEAIAPTAYLRALIHDAEGRPINASGRQRHPTTRQKRIVKERNQVCRDCGRVELLQHDHFPAYETSHHTLVDELQLRCAPCHARRHAA